MAASLTSSPSSWLVAGEAPEGVADRRRVRRRDDGTGRIVGEHPSLVQNNDVIVVTNFVDEVRRPKHADAFVRDEAAHDLENVRARLDIESGRRLVEQQHARTVQQRPRDLDPPHLAAREIARLVADPIGEADPRKLGGGPRARFARPNAVQRAHDRRGSARR